MLTIEEFLNTPMGIKYKESVKAYTEAKRKYCDLTEYDSKIYLEFKRCMEKEMQLRTKYLKIYPEFNELWIKILDQSSE